MSHYCGVCHFWLGVTTAADSVSTCKHASSYDMTYIVFWFHTATTLYCILFFAVVYFERIHAVIHSALID